MHAQALGELTWAHLCFSTDLQVLELDIGSNTRGMQAECDAR